MSVVGTPLQAIKYAITLEPDNMAVFLSDWALGEVHDWAPTFEQFCAKHPDEPEHVDENGIARKDHYGSGKQPWDTIKEKGWDAIFAACNVIKYLRRTKQPEADCEKARWYYARLSEAAKADPTMRAYNILVALQRELTPCELGKVKP